MVLPGSCILFGVRAMAERPAKLSHLSGEKPRAGLPGMLLAFCGAVKRAA